MTFTKILLLMLLLMALALLGLMLLERLRVVRPSAPAHITLEQVRELSELVTLKVPLHQLIETDLTGYTGATRCVVLARGEALISTNMARSQFELDPSRHLAQLTLPPPRVLSATLEHGDTSTLLVHRFGLWKIVPGEAGEAHLIDSALADAQKRMEQAASEPRRIEQARAATETLLARWFERHGWDLAIHWQDR